MGSLAERELTEEIFALDEGIRYVGILDRNHKLVESRMRPGVRSLTPEEVDKKFTSHASPIILDVCSQLTDQLGDLLQVTVRYRKVALVFFLYKSQIVALSLDPASIQQVLEKLRRKLGANVIG